MGRKKRCVYFYVLLYKDLTIFQLSSKRKRERCQAQLTACYSLGQARSGPPAVSGFDETERRGDVIPRSKVTASTTQLLLAEQKLVLWTQEMLVGWEAEPTRACLPPRPTLCPCTNYQGEMETATFRKAAFMGGWEVSPPP